MKKLFVYITLFAALGTLGACKKFLEKPPEGSVEETDALKSEADVLALLNGCYLKLGNDEMYNGRLQRLTELMGDHLAGGHLGGKPQENFLRRSTIFNTDNADAYTGIYNTVYRANKVLEKIDLVSDANKPKVEGEAKFIRAICHFETARLWSHNPGFTAENIHAGIPIRTSAAIAPPERATVKAVYDQIIADLKDAEAKLPAFNTSRTSADKNAARAFLAKVYFQMNRFADAYTYAALVINSANYTLATNLRTRYHALGSTETILRVTNVLGQHEPGGELRGGFSGRGNLPFLRYSEGFYNYVKGLTGDGRVAWLNNTKYTNNIYMNKYDSANFEMPIVFLTEMVLIRAESAGEIAGTNAAALPVGIADINKILERAYGNTSRNMAAGSTGDQLIKVVREQREIELMGEGDRLHQIKRIGAHPLANRRVERLDRRGSEWNCPGFIVQFPDYEKNANAAFPLNVEGGCL